MQVNAVPWILVVWVLVFVGVGVVAWFMYKASNNKPGLGLCTSDDDCVHGQCIPIPGNTAQKACLCEPNFMGPRCNQPLPFLVNNLAQNNRCDSFPRRCERNLDCASCDSKGLAYVCTDMQPSNNAMGLKGRFCAPQKPVAGCDTVESGGQGAGSWIYAGWSDVEATGWICSCNHPEYWTHGPNGDCTEPVAGLCQGGTYTGPRGPRRPFSCLGECGGCACPPNKTLAMDTSTGLPGCSTDPCAPGGTWTPNSAEASVLKDSPGMRGMYPMDGKCTCNQGYVYNGRTCVRPR